MRNHVVFRPTVIVGLGGTGHGAILKLKRRFIDMYGSVPPIIRFLSIDTAENVDYGETANDGSTVTIEPHERYVMSVANPSALLNSSNEHINKWWISNIPATAITAGAGQVRARGRLALFANSRNIFAVMRTAIDDVIQAKGTRQRFKETFGVSDRGGIDVYIVNGLSGGTGGGIFLDVAFIARSIIDSQSNITGVFVLPGIFRNLPGTALIKSNAYGALKEIERFSKMTPGDSFTIDYGIHQLEVTRPPFDMIYLMDNVNEKGNILTNLADILKLIADGLYIQISSQAGPELGNMVDNIMAHLASTGLISGHSANYCSFGVASLTVPHTEYETMRLYSARKLISAGLLSEPASDIGLENDVALFIRDHKINPSEADSVTETLGESAGGGRLRFPMALVEMKFDKAAAVIIKALHATHRSKVERQALQRINENYERLLRDLFRATDEIWEQVINRAHGLGYAQRFAETLLATLKQYQYEVRGKYEESTLRLKTVNFENIEEQVQQASESFFGRERRVRAACEGYRGLVNREIELYVQAIQYEKAAELYRALCLHVDSLKFRCDQIRLKLEAALDFFEFPHKEESGDVSAETPFEQAVQFNAEAHYPEIKPEDFLRWYLQEHGSLSAWADVGDDVLRDRIMAYVEECYRPLTDQSIEDILRLSPPDVVSQDLEQLRHKSAPLWRYDKGAIPLTHRDIEIYLYGVPDASQTLLEHTSVLDKVPHGAGRPAFVSTFDPQRITLLRVKIGVPLFALYNILDMERAYNDPDKTVSNHLHRDWESFPNIIPRATYVTALHWFAIATAPEPFELITRRGELYYIRSQQAKDTEQGEIRLGQGRLNAFRTFAMNRDLIKETEEKIDTILRTRGRAKVTRTLREYAEQLQNQVAGVAIDSSTREHVEGELLAINSYIQSLSTVSEN